MLSNPTPVGGVGVGVVVVVVVCVLLIDCILFGEMGFEPCTKKAAEAVLHKRSSHVPGRNIE